jgi:SNF2 family DNA or RNA helicase
MSAQIEVLNGSVKDWAKNLANQELNHSIFLERHPTYPTHFLVNSFDPVYIHHLKDFLGDYRAVSFFKVREMIEQAETYGYNNVYFLEDPNEVFSWLDALDIEYPYDLNVDHFPFQLTRFNFAKDLPADICNWSTGTGKSVFAISKAKYLLERGLIDKVIVCSRDHNKTNWMRDFKKIGDLEAYVVDAPGKTAAIQRERRAEIYKEEIVIINYEKLRFRDANDPKSSGDGDEILAACKGKRVYFIYDEMQKALKNPKTLAYKGAKQIIKKCKKSYQSMLSATPLQRNPEDVHGCVKLLELSMDKKIFGTLTAFRNEHAKSRNPFAPWKVQTWNMEKLREMGMKLAHITHQADKLRDPEIRAQFPEAHWEDIIIDMSPEDAKLYNIVAKEMVEELQLNPKENILARLLILQLICNNPLSLHKSDSKIAQRIVEKFTLTDKYCKKLQTLRELLDQIDGKVVLFSMYNELGSEILADYLEAWDIRYVLYKSQKDQDLFKADPRIKVFLSSDRGEDSINLEEATSVINYDLPWGTLTQRVNRIHRITSEAEHVFYYNLMMAGTMEERKMEVLEYKKAMDAAIFGDVIADQADALEELTRGDLWYILTGQS